MMHTITRFLPAAVILAAPAIFSQEPTMRCEEGNWNGERANHCEISETTLGALNSLTVDGGVNGGVSVKGWQKKEIWVRAKVQTQADTDARARDIARQVTIRTGGGHIIADGPTDQGHESWAVSYEVFVPQRIDLNLTAHNGGIHIGGVNGQIEFATTNGGVLLERLAGSVHGHTVNGGLSVDLAGNRWDGDRLDAETTNGGVSVMVPASYSAHLESGTVNGHINIEFPVTVNGEISRHLAVDLGSGGQLVRAVTTNGGVSIRRKNS